MKAEFIQNNYYVKEQACHLDRVVRINKYDSKTGNLTTSRRLRIRLRSFHSGSPGSYAIAEFWSGQSGWVEVLNWDIQYLFCKDACYLDAEDTYYDVFDTDAKYLIKKALDVLGA